MNATSRLDVLYRERFSAAERSDKDRVWQVLCTDFFAPYVPENATVLDVGAGYCEFINHVRAGRRIAVDANPELPQFVGRGVEAHCAPAEKLDFLEDGSVDVAFSSNFFEHLPSKVVLSAVVDEIFRVLKPGGRLLAMGPNVKYLAREYWDYYDHHIPLSEASVNELLRLAGFDVERLLPRFLPYTIKSRLPKWSWLIRAYLKLGPVAFPLFGKQFLVVARKGGPVSQSP